VYEVAKGTIPMKAYVITAGAIFGLLALAHVARVITEGPHMARNPWFIAVTVSAAALSFWAFCLLRRSSRS
jgi:hypothetical protein